MAEAKKITEKELKEKRSIAGKEAAATKKANAAKKTRKEKWNKIWKVVFWIVAILLIVFGSWLIVENIRWEAAKYSRETTVENQADSVADPATVAPVLESATNNSEKTQPEENTSESVVDLSAPEKTVSGYPSDGSKDEQVAWMSDLAVVNVNKIEDEPAGFYVNSKEAGAQRAVCPEGAACTWHLEDNRIVYFRGHGEVYNILAGTWRIEDQYPETICVMAANALENSIDEQFDLEFLGDVNDLCPNIFATGDPSKGEETTLMSELTDVPLIRISTEPGAWDINSKGVGLESFICIEGAVCTVHLGDDSLIFVIGNGQQFNAKAATIRLLKHYEETACQIWQKEQANGVSAHESVTCQ